LRLHRRDVAGRGEVGYHLTRELDAIGRFENTTDYAELLADFIGPFHDLRGGDHAREPYLHPDPAIGYPAGQALARELRAGGANGIIYPSVRHTNGTCLAAFRPDLVQNLREGGIWRLEWQGTPRPSVTRQTSSQPGRAPRPIGPVVCLYYCIFGSFLLNCLIYTAGLRHIRRFRDLRTRY
jgi:hypothetical protein